MIADGRNVDKNIHGELKEGVCNKDQTGYIKYTTWVEREIETRL